MNDLEKKFEEDMKNIFIKSKEELNYRPIRFLELITEKGGIEAAKILIRKETDGFITLWKNDRLDLSVEYHVLKPEYDELFTEEEKEICREKLKKYNFNI